MEEIRSLEELSMQSLYEAFQEAFKDYEMQLTRPELQKMLYRRGFTPHLSFGAFHGDRLVSFTLNGTGKFNELPTAYDTGTGTIEEYRGKGLARRIFEYSIPHLKGAGISQYLLEVLQHNTKAVSLYQKLGFRVSREFNYFTQSIHQLGLPDIDPVPGYEIRVTDLKDRNQMSSFWDHHPSWQNSYDAVDRMPEDFLILGAYIEDELAAYIIVELGSGDITQLATGKSHRRKGIASQLLRTALQSNRHPYIKAINYVTEDAGIRKFMEVFGISLKGKQFEMTKQL